MIVIHESTWRAQLSDKEKDELSERYGTTPLEFDQWVDMLERAGATDIEAEFEQWSQPEMFWKIRRDRDVKGPGSVMTTLERLRTMARILRRFGPKGVVMAQKNANAFFRAVLSGKIGYCLYWGRRA